MPAVTGGSELQRSDGRLHRRGGSLHRCKWISSTPVVAGKYHHPHRRPLLLVLHIHAKSHLAYQGRPQGESTRTSKLDLDLREEAVSQLVTVQGGERG